MYLVFCNPYCCRCGHLNITKSSCIIFRKSFWTPSASVPLPVKEIRAFVRARAVVWGKRLFCYHVDRGPGWFVMTTQRGPSWAFPALRWHRLGPRSKTMCLCFCSVNGADLTHQKHAGQMFAVTRCHFYAVTFLNAAAFSGYFACLRSACAEIGGKLGDWSGLEQSLKITGWIGSPHLDLSSALGIWGSTCCAGTRWAVDDRYRAILKMISLVQCDLFI